MKSNKLIWVLVTLLVTVTLAATFDRSGIQRQDVTSPILPDATPPTGGPDFSKYGIATFGGEESTNPSERERRRKISQRYDGEGWVIRDPQDKYGKIGRFREMEPPQIIPTGESDLIIVGKVVDLTTHLSNDKTGVYSEFEIKINEILKNKLSVNLGGVLTADRAGGVVQYSGGQFVLYLDSQQGIPQAGREYALFLRADTKSENYVIITLHELQETMTIPLDTGRNVDEIKRMSKSVFVNAIKDKLSKPSMDEEAWKNP